MKEYLAMWKNFINFYEQTTLRGYWIASLISFIVSMIIAAIAKAVPALSFAVPVYSIASLIPGLALTVRRLRDAGHRWTCIFIVLIPIVGAIILIVWLCQPTKTWIRDQV